MSLIRPNEQQMIDFASISNKAIWINPWLEWIIPGELEFSFVDKPDTHSYYITNHDSDTAATFEIHGLSYKSRKTFLK